MDLINIHHYRKDFLFNGRAYMLTTNSQEKLLELEEEQKRIGKEHTTIFQLETMYDFYKHCGMPANTAPVVAQLEIGDSRLISTHVADVRITRLSKSFCYIEWIK